MLYSKYQWKTLTADPEISGKLARDLRVSPLVASLMHARGIHTPEEARHFLHGDMELSHDPFLMLGMSQAVPRIRKAIADGEHILIYGDYDADGVSSTSLMIHLMRYLGASYDIYIPHRSNEGYGLHNHALDWAHQQGVSLVITVDTGISAVDQIAYANGLGIDVIVTDHHEPPEILPDAYTLINPKIPACPYPFKGLAGVGVAYKLAQALVGSPPAEWLEMVAIGTIADLMPLTGENRVLVKNGLLSMRQTRYPGVRALLEVSGVQPEQVKEMNIAFAAAPRINAAGRLDHAGIAVSLMTSEDRQEAERLAWDLDALNKERQQVVDNIVNEALAMIEKKCISGVVPSIIVVAQEGWNVGVVGIVASKILERYYRPVIVLGIDPETGYCKGSARSIPGLDIYEALTSCRDTMEHFGGHPAAAGMSLHRDKLQEFEASLCTFADNILTEELLIPICEADLECNLSDVPLQVIDELDLLGPFGMDNRVPKMVFRGVEIKEARKLGKEGKHLKVVIQQNGCTLEAVSFGNGCLADVLPQGTQLDVLGELAVNEWNGSRKPQLMITDICVPDTQVFDYRNCKTPVEDIKRWRAALELHLRCPAERSAVVSAKNSQLQIKSHLNDLSLWVYDRNAGILPANKVAEVGGCDAISVLFVLDVPETAWQLDHLLSMFSKVPNIFLLHPLRHKREQLQVPSREQFKKLYIMLAAIGNESVPEQEVIVRMHHQSSLSSRMLTKVLDVFEELEFITRIDGKVAFVSSPQKKPLDASRHFRELGQMAEMEQHLMNGNTAQLTRWMMSRTQGAS